MKKAPKGPNSEIVTAEYCIHGLEENPCLGNWDLLPLNLNPCRRFSDSSRRRVPVPELNEKRRRGCM